VPVGVPVGVSVGVREGLWVGVWDGVVVGVDVGWEVAVGVAVGVRVGVEVGVGVVTPWILRLTVCSPPPPTDNLAWTLPPALPGSGPHSSLTSIRMTMVSPT
jgi:hypothetical protein